MTGVFHRVEKKYILTREQFEAVLVEINKKLNPDIGFGHEDGKYSIASLYYDSPDMRFVRQAYESPGYKEKLRIRTYGVPSLDALVYVEIKKKIKGLGNKRRFEMPLRDAYEFLETNVILDKYQNSETGNVQVLKEIVNMHGRYGREIKPAALISYNRMAFNGAGNEGLRISFDYDVKGRQYDLRLELGAYGTDFLCARKLLTQFPAETKVSAFTTGCEKFAEQTFLTDNYVIMEIKTLNAFPLWLTKLLGSLGINPQSFSKYKTMYHSMIKVEAQNV